MFEGRLDCRCVQHGMVGLNSLAVTLMCTVGSALRASDLDTDIKDRHQKLRGWLTEDRLELKLCRARLFKLAAYTFDFRHHGQLFELPNEVKAPL